MQTKFLSYAILLLVVGWQITLDFQLNGSLNNLVPAIDDCDLVTTHLAISNNALNNPSLSGVVAGTYALILTVWTPTPQPYNQQIAFVAGSDEIALRGYGGDGKWGAWKKINVN